jgi:energy-coupling factor transporter ATP-binding protein EcfA2
MSCDAWGGKLMNSILYGNLRIELLTNVGGRLQPVSLRPTSQPAARQPVTAPSGETLPFLGREQELQRLRLAIQAGDPIELVGPCGFGKTTLLRQLASIASQETARPPVYLRLGKERLDDTLQRLFDASYTSPEPFKPTPEQRTQLLARVSSVVLLDDLTLSPREVGQLVASLPGCSLIVASTQPLLGRHGTSVTISGLTDRAAMELVAGDLGRPLTAAEAAAVGDLAAAVQGQPLHLHQAAALVREDGHALVELATRAARDPLVLDRLSVNALAEHERRLLAVLALAGGALLPRDLIGAIGDIATLSDSLGLLRRRGLIERHQDRFGLPICHVGTYRELLLKHLQLAGGLGTLSDWLMAQDPTSGQARSAIGGAVNALGYAAEHAEWPAVVRLVRVLEPILTLAGRWEASREALEHGLTAARQLGDRAAEALFSHQLGTLELSLDNLVQARVHLDHARQLREQLGDHAGAAVSSHNLAVLVPPDAVIAPPEPRSRRQAIAELPRAIARQWPMIAARAAVVALTFLLGILFLPRSSGTPQPPPASAQGTTTTTARGTTTITAAGATVTTIAGSPVAPPLVADTTPPVLRLPSDLTEEATSRNGAQIRFAASATDEVDGPVPVTCTPASGSTFPLGTTQVACAAIDRAGFAASGGFTVSVLDSMPPTLKLPGGVTVEATSRDGAQVHFAASASDRIDGPVPVACAPASGDVFPLGDTSVTCSAVDAAGLAAIGDFTVKVQDSEPPGLTLPGDLLVRATSPAGAVVTYQATASDAVDGPIGPTCAPGSGATFPVGATQVQCSVTDTHGNKASGRFKITVQEPQSPGPDLTPPALKLPKDMTVEATSADGAKVTYEASATDLVDGQVPVTCTPASGRPFPLGVTTVGCSAIDKAGNRAAGSFTITVKDTTGPAPVLPGDMTVEATSADGAVVTYQASATDLVDGAVPVACTPGSGSTFQLGVTTVACSATDKAGNTTRGSFTVTVQDHTAPRFDLPGDMTVEATSPAGATVNYPASATDLVDGPVPVPCTPASGEPFSLGVTTVNCSAADRAGNSATGSFTVTVRDGTPPVLELPKDMTVEATTRGGATVAYPASATDTVDGPVPITCAPPSGSFFKLGTTTVTCSAADKAGNTATGSFTVTVRDTPPTLVLPKHIEEDTDSPYGKTVQYTVLATDLVDDTVPVTCTPASGSFFKLGTTTVTCSATDSAGNTAKGGFTVTVELVEIGIDQQKGPPARAE